MKKLLFTIAGFFSLVNAQISPPIIHPPNPPTQQGTIKGTIKDNSENPAMFAMVMAVSADSLTTFSSSTTTDSEGNYTLLGLPIGKYYVGTIAQNTPIYPSVREMVWYGDTNNPLNAKVVEITIANPIAEDINITINLPTGQIKGKVLDAKGNPVENAQVYTHAKSNLPDSMVTILPIFPDRHQYAQTDENGEYTLEGLADGEYTVQVSANIGFQYDFQYYPNTQDLSQATAIKIENGVANISDVDFKLAISAGTATISGKVVLQTLTTLPYKSYVTLQPYYPITTDSLSISGWSGPGIEMPVYYHNGFAMVNPDGTYTFENVEVGTYIVSAYVYGQGNESDFQYYQNTQDYTQATPIEVADAQNVTGIDFSLNPQNPFGSISGKITTSNGSPVEGAYVSLGGDFDYMMGMPTLLPYYRPFWGGAITDANGEYKIEMVYKGEYTIKAHLNGASTAQKITVNGDQNTLVNFTLNPPVLDAKITGKISDEETGNPLWAYVTATDIENGATFFNKTDDMGNYTLEVPSGKYTVFTWSFHHMGEYYDNTMDATLAKTVETSVNQAANNINFALTAFQFMPPVDSLGVVILPGFPEMGVNGGTSGRSTAQVLGMVKDAQGNVIEGASVYAYDENGKAVAFARTDVSGNYSIENLPSGDDFKFHASAVGFDARFSNGTSQAERAEVVSMDNAQVRKDFELSRKSSVGVDAENPTEFTLSGNYPNPFSNETQISFSLPETQKVTIRVIDITGREVLTFSEMQLEAGSQKLKVDGSQLNAGTYFYRIETNKGTFNGKMTVIR